MMKKRFFLVFLGLVSLESITFAQPVMPCGMRPVVNDSSSNQCVMKNNGKCNKVMFVITGFPNVRGIGAHISSSNHSRPRKPFIECFIVSKRNDARLHVVEKYGTRGTNGESYDLPLGLLRDLDSVMVAVSRRMVKVTVNKHSTAKSGSKNRGGTKKEKIPYVVEAIFPVREDSGFCSQESIFYRANGAYRKLKGVGRQRLGKSGSGYLISAYRAPF